MILVGDVGGTRTRLALAARAGSSWELTGLEESPTTPDLPEKVARFRAGHRIEAAAFGGAGPVGEDGRIPLTNAGFTLDPVRLGEAVGVSRAVLVNDFWTKPTVAHARLSRWRLSALPAIMCPNMPSAASIYLRMK